MSELPTSYLWQLQQACNCFPLWPSTGSLQHPPASLLPSQSTRSLQYLGLLPKCPSCLTLTFRSIPNLMLWKEGKSCVPRMYGGDCNTATILWAGQKGSRTKNKVILALAQMELCLFAWPSCWHATDLCQSIDQGLGSPALQHYWFHSFEFVTVQICIYWTCIANSAFKLSLWANHMLELQYSSHGNYFPITRPLLYF